MAGRGLGAALLLMGEMPAEGLATRRGAGRAAGRERGAVLVGLARADNFSRCTLPITALRVTPSPSSPAIWLAERPSIQSFFKVSTRSSVQPADCAPDTIVKTESFIAPPIGYWQPSNARRRMSVGFAARDIVFPMSVSLLHRRNRDQESAPTFPEKSVVKTLLPILESNQ